MPLPYVGHSGGIWCGTAAVPLTPGFRVASLASYYDAYVVGPASQATGLHYQFPNVTLMAIWVPDLTILGAAYKAFTLVPISPAS